MNSVGNTLRCERLRLGLKLEGVAAETKVARHFLEAMENDQFDRLPGTRFRCRLLRQYAHTLRLDEDEVIRSFQQELAMVPGRCPRRRLIVPRSDCRRYRRRYGCRGLLAFAGLYSWYGQGTASRAIESELEIGASH